MISKIMIITFINFLEILRNEIIKYTTTKITNREIIFACIVVILNPKEEIFFIIQAIAEDVASPVFCRIFVIIAEKSIN